MRELKRLSFASPNPLTRALLRSGRVDRPSPQARYGAVVALGMTSTVTATTTAASAATAGAAGAAAGGAGTATASKWTAVAAIMKWVGAAATSGALAFGAAHEYGEHTRDSRPAMSEGATQPSATGGARSRTSVPSASLAGTSTAAPESGAPAVAAHAEEAIQADVPNANESRSDIAISIKAPLHRSSLGRPGEAATASRDLRDEVTTLDRVRSALSSNDEASALEALRAYDRAFAGGSLASEAEVLRIEVLVRAGRRKEAMGVAQQWLSREPNGPQARHVRRILDAMGSDAHAPGHDAHP